MVYEVYTVTVGTGILSVDGKNAESETVLTFQTLPDPPTVVTTYPVRQGKQLPLNTPLAIQFSRSMNPDSVENAISFEPALAGLGFVWSEDHSLVYLISDEMEHVTYTVTISTVATDVYGLALVEPYTFTFNTWATSVEDYDPSGVAIYPNPASEILQVRGMDVASVKVYDLAGQLMKEIYNSSVINVSDMEPGSYVLTVSDREDNLVRKMIVIE
jgi:hypothetical protein